MDAKRFTREISVNGKDYTLYDIKGLEQEGLGRIDRLPFSIRILVENLLRHLDNRVVRQSDLANIAAWQKRYDTPPEIPYHPARVLMQDFTGVPAVVDLAAMRDAMAALGGDPAKVNPLVPTELVIDHSVQVDHFGTVDAIGYNVDREYQRNGERYTFLKWAQKSFANFKVVPPRSGICHQVNLEYLGRVVIATEQEGKIFAFPDTLVGLDSHTTMIDAIGVMGWGVGGIEAEAVMLGQPYFMSIPEVIGVRLSGSLAPGVTATDLVLTVTQVLRNYGVVEKFVEFFGPGMKALTVPERATIANMSPEYGATMGFFPVDEKTIAYLQMTNRREQATLVEAYTRANALFYTGAETPEYTDIVDIDLATVVPCVSGPARPQDRIPLTELKTRTARLTDIPAGKVLHQIDLNGKPVLLGDDSVVIAAITSCTNTSNPSLMLGAGLLAKRAVERGVQVPGAVRTSFAPGSKVVVQYLNDAGLMPYLEALGFHLAGFGCTTCIGNSGPLAAEVEKAIIDHNLNVAAVLSGNRNFEARIHQRVKTNYLASPMLVVAFALAGRVDIDFAVEPVGIDPNGLPVFLVDLWPEDSDIAALVERHVKEQFFAVEYGRIFAGDENWHKLPEVASITYAWDANSTYIKRPPYFDDFQMEPQIPGDISSARVLLVLGDMVTTDHISPAGAIPAHYPAGEYLQSLAVPVEAFNSYGSRRGNHEVMVRGSFGNIRLKNLLAGGKEGSFTRIFPEGRECFVHQAAGFYQAANTPLIVLAGLEYGAGSSRDWAAKGSKLLGVKAVIARSFERIHRSNLVGMGVLPLVFQDGEHAASLGLDGSESFSICGIAAITPRGRLQVEAKKADGRLITFTVISRLDTEVDIEYFRHGGILPYVLRRLYRG